MNFPGKCRNPCVLTGMMNIPTEMFGMINKIPISLFKKIRNTGLKAILLKPKDELLGALYTTGKNKIMLIIMPAKIILPGILFFRKIINTKGKIAYVAIEK